MVVEMEHLKKSIDSHEFKLFGDEEKLFRYLVEGKSDLVTPQLVASVREILYVKDDLEEKRKETSRQLEIHEREFKKIFENVGKLLQ